MPLHARLLHSTGSVTVVPTTSRTLRATCRATPTPSHGLGYPSSPVSLKNISAINGRQILYETRLRPAIESKPMRAGKLLPHLGSPFISPRVLSTRTLTTKSSMSPTDSEATDALVGSLSNAPPWPCPALNDAEIKSYLPFLFSRRWGLMLNEKNVPVLACKYRIKGYSHILSFVQSVGKIAQDEDHHPEITLDGRSVFVRVNTHCACRDKAETNEKENGSGITLRDIRFAILVERAVDGLRNTETAISRLNPKVLSRPEIISSSDIFVPSEQVLI